MFTDILSSKDGLLGQCLLHTGESRNCNVSMLLYEEVDTRNSIPFSTNIESNLLISIKGNLGTRGFN